MGAYSGGFLARKALPQPMQQARCPHCSTKLDGGWSAHAHECPWPLEQWRRITNADLGAAWSGSLGNAHHGGLHWVDGRLGNMQNDAALCNALEGNGRWYLYEIPSAALAQLRVTQTDAAALGNALLNHHTEGSQSWWTRMWRWLVRR